MTWKPDGTVLIDSVEYTDKTLWNVQISYGRSNIWDQSRAGFANIQIASLDGTHFNIEVNDPVVIKVKDSANVDVTVFTGKVTDVQNSVQASGDAGTVVISTVTAIAPLGQMARAIVGSSAYPKEYDDDRMTTILTESGVTIDVVDSPGVYEFTARSADPADAYTLATYYAQMAFGYVYETTDGKVGYANESRRLNEVQDYGYWVIPENYILWSGVSSNRSLNDIMNSITLTYKANAIVTASDAGSISTYGEIGSRVNTELEQGSEAQYQADHYIGLRAYPQTNLSQFSVMLDSSFVSSADLDIFLAMYMGKPIEILNLPNAVLDSVYKGFIEGWVLSFNQYQANMTLTSTDSSLSIVPTRWQDVSALQKWSDVGALVKWFEYE
jgi:hypothetical protein